MESEFLTCPIRGQLNQTALACDGLTTTEEARRIEFIEFLIRKGYPVDHIAVETVVIRNIGEHGRNKLRSDVIVYDVPVGDLPGDTPASRLTHAVIVAEIKRDASKKNIGIECQLKPAMIQLPRVDAMGVYWADAERILFIKSLVRGGAGEVIDVTHTNIERLPDYGRTYAERPITLDDLSPPDNLVALLFNVANVMRSHGVNDEHLRYKETVKLILARYCDERAAAETDDKELSIQVLPGADPGFSARVRALYDVASRRYSRAKTLFRPVAPSELDERTLREVVRTIQGVSFSDASNDVMQQIFMSFVPAVFKKNLDQYFTPLTLIEAMVEFSRIGPNDRIADPAMGTGDFLTAAMDYRARMGDTDVHQRVYGADTDAKAFDLAVINMILNHDGQSNLLHADSIADHARWAEAIDVALCNPPFGEKSLETRADVLKHYDLGHRWEYDGKARRWLKTAELLPDQQLGILFIERCVKLLAERGRIAIILPEGYLCTSSYGYVRQWMLSTLRLVCLVELPRRIFLKSNADLRSNIVIGQKLPPGELATLQSKNYPVFTGLIRKVGYKLGKGFSATYKRDPVTGNELRDASNDLVIDSDFSGVRERFAAFSDQTKWPLPAAKQVLAPAGYAGGRYNDIARHPALDMKPRRLTPRALSNRRLLEAGPHVKLGEVADLIEATIDFSGADAGKLWRLIEGIDIRATDGFVVPQFPSRGWQVLAKKGKAGIPVAKGDIIIGLVRPERRNIGMALHDHTNMVGTPDGLAVLRVKPKQAKHYPQDWLFAQLRAESSRIQLWTESGGTSYGKLTEDHILNLLIATPDVGVIKAEATRVAAWKKAMTSAFSHWETIGTEDDRRPIINSAIIGLEAAVAEDDDDDDQEVA